MEEEASGFRVVWNVDSTECLDLGTEFTDANGTTESPRVSLWPFV